MKRLALLLVLFLTLSSCTTTIRTNRLILHTHSPVTDRGPIIHIDPLFGLPD